jgi:Endonuclease NucS
MSETDGTVRRHAATRRTRRGSAIQAASPPGLPEAVRLLMFKADGSFLVHEDAGGFRPLNWIRREFRRGLTPPTAGARFGPH